ncbi:unnamed protein product, partial [Brenthis ino]
MLWIAVFCLTVLQVQTLEPPSDNNCKRSWHNVKNPLKCCNMPTIYKDEDFKACGIEKPVMNDGDAKPRPPDCDKQICLLQKNNLMKDENTIDKAAIAAFLDKWAEINVDFKDAVEITKNKCINGELMGPPNMCEANKISLCILAYIYRNCPKWEETDDCAQIKDFIGKCPPP